MWRATSLIELLRVFTGFNTWPQQALLLNRHQLSKERVRTEGEFHNFYLFACVGQVIK